MANCRRRMTSPLSSFFAVLLIVAAHGRWISWMTWCPKPAKPVVVAIGGGGGGGVVGTLAAPLCLQCRCCSKANPSNCQLTSCSSTFNCDPAGKCTLVQQRCGC
uniref:Bowman-Birk serine protease inhibitors family domain-containing protein n=1 Tax=Oryza meridionalis TaxID=40149 RepID=A0A0E0FBQ8_9ORYZ